MPRRARLAAVVLVAALVSGACSSGTDGSGADAAGAPSRVDGAVFGADDLPPLHLEGGEHPRIADADGRQVLLRGVNLNTLADYDRPVPGLEPTFPHDDGEFAEMAALGFDVVRLLVSWSRLEPEPGRIDDEYVADVRAAVDAAAAEGLYTVVDMHQDAFSKHVATPADVACPAGLQRAVGWDGAPAWATLTDGRSTCNNGSRETSGAVVAAWTNFWADTDGVQGHLVEVWARLAGEFADEPAVAGYDLLNEPGIGPGVDATNEALARFHRRALEAIRSAEDDAGGFPHLVFFEPVILWSGLGVAPVPPPFSDDANLVFAPHLYAESITAGDVTIAGGFDHAARVAAEHDTTFWVGEYGWFGDPDEQAGLVAEYGRQEDRHLVGGAWWQWRQACGDPHSIGGRPGEAPPDVLVHLHRTACPSGEDLGLTQPWATTLSRTYPRSAPGRLTRLRNDAASGAARIRGEVDGDGTLVLWVPDRGLGAPLVSAADGALGEVVAGDGGYRVEVPVRGAYEVRVTPADALAVGGATEG
ncbi:MAG: cellulase family glycosylhydrolase [Acidimicrobiales bacterium]|nr:cellulase family glycosylhydrolase [Acidimicrobiales bacterium]